MNKQKNLIIGGLLAVVLVMVIGYAAFATRLNITGTSEITSSWGIEIKSISADKTSNCTDANNVSTCTTVGDIESSVNPTNKLSASFRTALIKPGDSVVYTVTVENKGNLDAKLNSLTLSDPDNEYIDFSVNGIQQGDTLTVSERTKTFTVTVTYVNKTNGQGQPTKTDSSFTLTLNYVQDDGSSSPGGSQSTGLYALSTSGITKGVSTISQVGTTSSSCAATGANTCLKYTTEGDTITGVDVCFVKNGTEHCLQGWVDECVRGGENSDCTFEGTKTTYNNNIIKLQNAFTETDACNEFGSACSAGDLYAEADSEGHAYASDGSYQCYSNIENGVSIAICEEAKKDEDGGK